MPPEPVSTEVTASKDLAAQDAAEALKKKEAIAAEEAAVKEVQALIAAYEPKVGEIDPFTWNTGYQYQAVVQKMKVLHLPEGALQYLMHETGWVQDAYQPEKWREEDAIAVGLSQIECPHCRGNHTIERAFHGKVTGIRVTMPMPCMCQFNREYYSRWQDPANVPAGYRKVNLSNLHNFRSNFGTFVTDTAKTASLSTLIATVTDNPHNCYLLVGPAGTGKTTLMVAMYQRALANWAIRSFQSRKATPAVWKVNATALAKQFREWELRFGKDPDSGPPTQPPEVTAKKVFAAVRAGYIPCLFLDELDKFKMDSDFQAKEFSEVIDAIQSNGGQVFASSNIGPASLEKSLGSQFGPAIVRRLCGARMNPDNPNVIDDPTVGGFLIDFWAGSIQQNYKTNPPSHEPVHSVNRGSGYLSTSEFIQRVSNAATASPRGQGKETFQSRAAGMVRDRASRVQEPLEGRASPSTITQVRGGFKFGGPSGYKPPAA